MKKIFTLLLIVFVTATVISAQRVFVKAGATGDGSSWVAATGDLKGALDAASAGTEIWVAKGTYYAITCGSCDFTAQSTYFELKDGVQLIGGFSGSETNMSQRDPATNLTILSGDIDQDGTLSGNAFTVLYTRNVSEATVVDGFTITMASATTTGGSTESHFQSGAWFNDGSLQGFRSNPVVRNCIFKDNEAIAHGAAMFNYGGFSGEASVQYEQCSFLNNYSINAGGAVYSNAVFSGRASAKFTDCIFDNNTSDNSGGAVFNNGAEGGISNATFVDCEFSNNTSTKVDGGAVYSFGKNGESSPGFTDCQFIKNTAHLFGGAVVNDGSFTGKSDAAFLRCSFT
ncbi:MAG: hypothetical protein AAFO94_18760, partial [Bacteroidota bacterium]